MAVVACGVVFLLGGLAVVATRNRLGIGYSIREAILGSASLCGAFVVATTESLGAVGQLRFGPVLAAWVLAGLGLAAVVWFNRRALAGFWVRSPLRCIDAVLISLLMAVCLAAGLLAVSCPPNNWDVTLYHLPRQLQWLQQGSVAHFPTQDYRLTVNPPFAEFVGLHLLILSGTDRFAPVESWTAMVLTLVAVSLVAREVGLTRRGQLLATLFAVTIPVGFHEAVNGKNDWLVSFWLAVTTFWVIQVWKARPIRFASGVFAGLAVGLLVLTKGTGGVYAAPAVALGCLGLAARRPRGWVLAAAMVAILTVAVNTCHWYRNVAAYGSVSGRTFGLGNERQGPRVWASGVIRNIGMHLALPKDSWNYKIERYVRRMHRGLGIEPNNRETSWQGFPFQVLYRPQYEDLATAPAHALLLLATFPALLLALTRAKLRPGSAREQGLAHPDGATRSFPGSEGCTPWLIYLLTTIGGFACFCVVFKWQPWHPRLHIPLMALGGVAVGWLFTRPGIRWAAPLAVAGLILSVIPAATQGESRSLGPKGLVTVFQDDKELLRYFGNPNLRDNSQEVVKTVQAMHPRTVDLINQPTLPWEYPIALELRSGGDPPQIGYFYPVSGSPPVGRPADVVIDIGSEFPPELIRHPRTRVVYRLAKRFGIFTIYHPLTPGTKYASYRLTESGEWESIAGTQPSPPPGCDQPVARYGIGVEPPAGH